MEKEDNCEQPKKATSQKQIVQSFFDQNGSIRTKIYRKEKFLGKGGYAKCFQTRNMLNNKVMATKIILKSRLDSNRLRHQMASQIKLHKSLRHPNVVEFYTSFQDEDNYYINLELCENGSIVDLLRIRQTLKTPEIQSILLGLCEGVSYLHSRAIIHRDLKIGNIFLSSNNIVKIGDFGLATRLEIPRERKRTACGTPNYVAPEILGGIGYSYEVDIWSIGIILYSLFCCIGPFEDQTEDQMFQHIKRCEYSFPSGHQIPKQGIDLIKRILVQNPCNRPSIQQILDHPFMSLGTSIPIGLPNIIFTRAPTKKQLQAWRRQNQKNANFEKAWEEKESQQSFNSLRSSFRPQSKVHIQSFAFSEKDLCFVVVCEKVEEDLIFFLLNNGSYGVIDLNKKEMYVKNIRQMRRVENRRVRKVEMDQNFKFKLEKIEQICLEKCPHRVFLSLKQKQMKSLQYLQIMSCLQLDMANYHISKCIKSKNNDFCIFKLDHPEKELIQIVFEDKNDGYIFFDHATIMYFPSFLPKAEDQKQNRSSKYDCWKIQNPFQTEGNELTHSEGRKVKKNGNWPQSKGMSWKKLNIMKQILKQALGKYWIRDSNEAFQ